MKAIIHPATTTVSRKTVSELVGKILQSGCPVLLSSVVLDKDLLLDKKLKIFDHQAKTIVFNEKENLELDNIYRVKIAFDQQLIHNLLTVLAQHKIGTLMVEGGATLLDSFYHDNLWDEARVITSANYLVNGLKAPMPEKVPSQSFQLESDEISVYLNDLGC